ncbi:MAG: toprim domain-containing protein [Deltaproteobacteria bacterium]|nr:toprim domain-containing protein [Deltaproteobacteria bacterium]
MNDDTVKGYGYYCRQINFTRKDPFSRNYGDYFAFYNLLQNQDKPVVVSTLGSYLTPEAANILKGLDIEHFIVAYDWDEAARNGIERIAAKLGGWVYYLGGLAEGQDPYDMLKPVVNAISGFSLKHLKTDAQRAGRRQDVKMANIRGDDVWTHVEELI